VHLLRQVLHLSLLAVLVDCTVHRLASSSDSCGFSYGDQPGVLLNHRHYASPVRILIPQLRSSEFSAGRHLPLGRREPGGIHAQHAADQQPPEPADWSSRILHPPRQLESGQPVRIPLLLLQRLGHHPFFSCGLGPLQRCNCKLEQHSLPRSDQQGDGPGWCIR